MLTMVQSSVKSLQVAFALYCLALSACTVAHRGLARVAPKVRARSSYVPTLLVEQEAARNCSQGLYLKNIKYPLEASSEEEEEEEERTKGEQDLLVDRLRHILENFRPTGIEADWPSWMLDRFHFDQDLNSKLHDAVKGVNLDIPADSDILLMAVEKGNWQVVNFLLRTRLISSVDQMRTALHKAASLGMMECFEKLLVISAIPGGVQSVIAGDALLTLAVKSGSPILVKFLLENQAFFDPRYNNDEALMAASMSKAVGNVQVLQLMIAKIDPRVQGNGAILNTVRSNLPDLLRVLLADPRVNPSCLGNEPMYIYLSKANIDRDIFRQLYLHPKFDPRADKYALLTKLAKRKTKHWKAAEILAHPRANIRTCLEVLRKETTGAAQELAELAQIIVDGTINPDNPEHINFFLNYMSWRNEHVQVRGFVNQFKSSMSNQVALYRSHRNLVLRQLGHFETLYELRHEISVSCAAIRDVTLGHAFDFGNLPMLEFFWYQMKKNPEVGKYLTAYQKVESSLYWMKGADRIIDAMQATIKELKEKQYKDMPWHQQMLEIAMKHYTAMFTVAAQMKEPMVVDVSELILKNSWMTYADPNITPVLPFPA